MSTPDIADDCTFCNFAEPPALRHDVRWRVGEGLFIMPALGMLTSGQFMVVTDEHVTSFAQLGRDRLREADDSIRECEQYLEEKIGFSPSIRIEHGSDNIESCGSGGCIDHAHMHLVRGQDVGKIISEHGDVKGRWDHIDGFEDISGYAEEPYLYLGELAVDRGEARPEHGVVRDPQLSGQWFRRVLASHQGRFDWDYAVTADDGEWLETCARLRRFPRGRVTVSSSGNVEAYEPSRSEFARYDQEIPDLTATIVW